MISLKITRYIFFFYFVSCTRFLCIYRSVYIHFFLYDFQIVKFIKSITERVFVLIISLSESLKRAFFVWKGGAKGRVRRRRRGAECKVESNWATPGALDVFAFLSPFIYIYIYCRCCLLLFFLSPSFGSFLSCAMSWKERGSNSIYKHHRRVYIHAIHYIPIYIIYGGDERVVLAPRTTPPDLRCNKVLVFISLKFSAKWKCACVRAARRIYSLSHNLSNKRLFGRRKSRGYREKNVGHKHGPLNANRSNPLSPARI